MTYIDALLLLVLTIFAAAGCSNGRRNRPSCEEQSRGIHTAAKDKKEHCYAYYWGQSKPLSFYCLKYVKELQ